MFEIRDDRLFIDGRAARYVPSPNHGGRIEPTLIVLHDTADRLKADDSVAWFQDPASKVSAHFVVGRDGSITQMVDCDRSAWHAGKSNWRGRENCNGFSIGIEIDNPGKLTPRGEGAVAWFGETFPLADCARSDASCTTHGPGAWLNYTPEQIDAVSRLIWALSQAYPSIVDVAGHFEISPRRKVDPGPHFPMSEMRRALANKPAQPRYDLAAVQRRLQELGYAPGDADGIIGPRTRGAIRTFQEQNSLDITGEIDAATAKALASAYAKEMPLAHRETITREDVAAEGSTSVQLTGGTKRAAEVGITTALVLAQTGDTPAPVVVPKIETLPDPEKVVTAIESSRSLGERIVDIGHWALTPRGLTTIAVIVALTAVWAFANKVEFRRVLKARLGLG